MQKEMMDRLLNIAYDYGCNAVYDFKNNITFHDNDYSCYCSKGQIYISKSLVEDNDEALLFVVIHEILHIVGKSFERYDTLYEPGGFSLTAANIQEDQLINDFLKKNLKDGWEYLNIKYKEYIKSMVDEEQVKQVEKEKIMLIDNTNYIEELSQMNNLSYVGLYNAWVNDFKGYILYDKICNIGLKKIEDTYHYIVGETSKFDDLDFIKVVIHDFNNIPNKPMKFNINNISEFHKINFDKIIYKNKIIKFDNLKNLCKEDLFLLYKQDLFLLWKILNKRKLLPKNFQTVLKTLRILYIIIMNEEISNALQDFSSILNELKQEGKAGIGEWDTNKKLTNFEDGISNQYSEHEKIFKDLQDKLSDLNIEGLMAGKEHSFFKKTKKTYKHKKLDNKIINKFERIILSYIDKFYVKGGVSRTYKRPHRLIEELKGRIHKKRNFKNVTIYLDYSSSMSGRPINKLRDAYYSINKSLQRRRMIGFYRPFNTELEKPMTYRKFIDKGYKPNGGTNINNVLNQLNESEYNIVITDAEDNINFDLINENTKILWFIIGKRNYNNVKKNETKNIKIILLENK